MSYLTPSWCEKSTGTLLPATVLILVTGSVRAEEKPSLKCMETEGNVLKILPGI